MSEISSVRMPARLRSPRNCQHIRLRATITIDLEAEDSVQAEGLKAKLANEYELLRREYLSAKLEFRQRKTRSRPRAASPAVVMAVYLDD